MPQTPFSHRIIKGRVAETIVQELFQNNGYNVFSYGMERTVPALLRGIRGHDDEVSKAIRSMPDFVMQNTNTGDLYYIEVKFRSNGRFELKNLIENYPYVNAHFIIVSTNNILYVTYDDLKKGLQPAPIQNKNLFNLSASSLKKFREYVVEFFQR